MYHDQVAQRDTTISDLLTSMQSSGDALDSLASATPALTQQQ
jgi:hypothetical protein